MENVVSAHLVAHVAHGLSAVTGKVKRARDVGLLSLLAASTTEQCPVRFFSNLVNFFDRFLAYCAVYNSSDLIL